jgi:hypothetical protein
MVGSRKALDAFERLVVKRDERGTAAILRTIKNKYLSSAIMYGL